MLESKDLAHDSTGRLMVSGDLESGRNASLVCINSIPVLNVFDLTRASHNMRRIRQGSVSQPQDLESVTKPDEKVKESELSQIEREANKRKRKRVKA